MSKEYLELSKIGNIDLRLWSQRPGKEQDGKPVYFTQQSQKEQCDVNNVIRRYKKGETITQVSNFEHQFGDMTGVEFKTAMDMIASAKSSFEQMPSKIRKRFENSPQKLLEFMENSDNRDEAIELGIINKGWSPETDGLGEHVEKDQNVREDIIDNPPTKETT